MDSENKIVQLNVNDVLPNRFQPRIKFNEDSINELSESIKKYGVIEPIVVRMIGDKYEIIAGERRYKASLLAGKDTVPAIITTLDDKDSAEVALIENVQREDLTPIEEAISYKKILDMGYLTQDELATKLGKNQSTVANKLRLLNLAEDVQEALLEEKISERHARSLLKLKNENDQLSMLNRIVTERLTVRKTDDEISKMLRPEPIIIEEPRKEENNMEEFNPFINNNINPQGDINMPKDEAVVVRDDYSNPGFMDVYGIEKNAQTINPIKEEVDIESLLNSIPTFDQVEVPDSVGEVQSFESPVQPVIEEPVEIESPIEIPKFEENDSIQSNNGESKFFTIPFEENSFNDFNPFNQPMPSVAQNLNQTVEVPNIAEPVQNIQSSNINAAANSAFSFDFMPVENNIKKEEVDELDSLPLFKDNFVPTDNLSVSEPSLISEDMMKISVNNDNYDIINSKIDNLMNELNSLGYVVNVSKQDLSGSYQVILDIRK